MLIQILTFPDNINSLLNSTSEDAPSIETPLTQRSSFACPLPRAGSMIFVPSPDAQTI